MRGPKIKLPKGIRKEENRHGKTIYYYRPSQGAKRIRLSGVPFSEEFIKSFNDAVRNYDSRTVSTRAAVGTIEWFVTQYKASPEWAALSSSTKRARDLILSRLVSAFGKYQVSQLDAETIEKSRDAAAGRTKCGKLKNPEAGNARVKVLRTMFGWAIRSHAMRRYVKDNPAARVSLLKNDSDGFPAWTAEELRRFEATWPMGTRERLAYTLLLYTGLRRSDVVRLGPEHLQAGVISINPAKTPNVTVTRAIAPQLQEALNYPLQSMPKEGSTFFRCEDGKPMKATSFTNWFRRACAQAGVPKSAHGLRKAAACQLAEAGASERELMAAFGWSSGKQAQHYTKAADNKRLGLAASERLQKWVEQQRPPWED